jgi:transglutaminase-like putative cysteine protease
MRRAVLLALLAAGGVTLAAAAANPGELTRSPAPAWVRTVTWSESPVPATTNGFVDRLADYQVNIETEETYTHFVYLITTPGALNNGSQLAISFDPSFQSVSLHTAKRWRAGVALSQDDASFRVIQREESLEQSVYSGEQTWLAFLKDVQVGDTIEVAYTVRGFNPVFAGRYCASYGLQTSTPTQRALLRVLSPPGRTPAFRVANSTVAPTVGTAGGRQEYSLALSDLPPVTYEENLPYGFQPGVRVDISEFAGWPEVAAWGAALYAPAVDVGSGTAGGDIAATAREVTEGQETDEQKALAILRWVQDSVRYLGIETGINSHQPRAAAEVLANRFGDCKDKVALLLGMLKAAGVRAWPVLVHTWRQDLVHAGLPSPLAFNHVIAALSLSTRGTIYVDPTRSNQGGPIAQSGLSDFGWGLPLLPGTRDLVALPAPTVSVYSKAEVFQVADLSGPAELSVRYEYRSMAADDMRGWIAESGLDGVQKGITDSARDLYGDLTVTTPVDISDIRESNVIVVRMGLHLEKFLSTEKSTTTFALFPSLILDKLKAPAGTDPRTQPGYVPFPVDITQWQEVDLPVDWAVATGTRTVKNSLFRASSTVTSTNRVVKVQSEYHTLAGRVEPGAAWDRYVADLKSARSAVYHPLAYTPGATSKAGDNANGQVLGIILGAALVFLAAALGMGSDF